jgi:hypothetical protein
MRKFAQSGHPVTVCVHKRAVLALSQMCPRGLALNSSKWLAVDTFQGDVENRVTRLGEFSPIGRLLTMGSFSKITAQYFCLLFLTILVMY